MVSEIIRFLEIHLFMCMYTLQGIGTSENNFTLPVRLIEGNHTSEDASCSSSMDGGTRTNGQVNASLIVTTTQPAPTQKESTRMLDVLTDYLQQNDQYELKNSSFQRSKTPILLTCINRHMEQLEFSSKRIAHTAVSVSLVVEEVFGEQLRSWQACMDRGLIHGQIVVRSQQENSGIIPD